MWEEMKGRLLVKGNCNGKHCFINCFSIFDGVVFSESFDIYSAENLVIWCSKGNDGTFPLRMALITLFF